MKLVVIEHENIALHQGARPIKLWMLQEQVQEAIRRVQTDIEFNDTVWVRQHSSILFIYFGETHRLQVFLDKTI